VPKKHRRRLQHIAIPKTLQTHGFFPWRGIVCLAHNAAGSIGLTSIFTLKAGDGQSGTVTMNKDQVKGEARDIAGKIQEEAGKLVGSKEQQAKGLSKQISGKLQKGLGDVKESMKDRNKP